MAGGTDGEIFGDAFDQTEDDGFVPLHEEGYRLDGWGWLIDRVEGERECDFICELRIWCGLLL